MNIDLQPAEKIFSYVAHHLWKAATAVVQADSFLFWPYLAGALAIVVVYTLVGLRSGDGVSSSSWRERLRSACNASIWWSRSARADYRLYFANALALPVIVGAVVFTEGNVIASLTAFFGASTPASSSEGASVAMRVAFTIAFFVAYDFGRFAAHCLLHDVPVLWEFHKVHHSAETLNPMTAFRAHPVELVVNAWIPAVTTGIVTWSFNQYAGTHVTAFAFLGLHALIFPFNVVATLRHTNVWLTYGPRWGRWFISPAHHQLHHSCEAKHLGCNRGFDIALWDRLYGTLYVPTARETFRIGLGDGTEGQWHSVERMYLAPFANAGRRLLESVRALARGRSSA